ncbi:MAG: T9SS type A sorting domain-containing protein [Saprospiraceae bacterium]|nr:T9SS type A sorting domain-containing protein [Saprospiraceae bacterium]
MKKIFLLCITKILLSVFPFSGNTQSLYENDWCQNATLLDVDTVITGSILLPAFDTFFCPEEKVFHGIWYRYAGNNKRVSLTEKTPAAAGFIFYLFEGDCDNLRCITDSRSSFYAESGKDYYIFIGKYNYQCDPVSFSFIYKEEETPAYDLCSGAKHMNCGETFRMDFSKLSAESSSAVSCASGIWPTGWISFTGDGTVRQLSWDSYYVRATVFVGNCRQNICANSIEGVRSLQVSTEVGKEYFIALYYNYWVEPETVAFSLQCNGESQPHANISTAIPLLCGETVQDVIDWTASDFVEKFYPSLWYKLNNVVGKQKISVEITNVYNLIVHVFAAPVAFPDSMHLVAALDVNQLHDIFVNTKELSTVYLRFSMRNPESFSFTTSCHPVLDEQFSCQCARNLSCGDTIDVYQVYRGKNSDCDGNLNRDNGFWYTLQGQEEAYILTSADPLVYGYIEYSLFLDSCGITKPTKEGSFAFEENGTLSFIVPPGQTVYLFFKNTYGPVNKKLILSCGSFEDNNICSFAEEIFCGASFNLKNTSEIVFTDTQKCGNFSGKWYTFSGDGNIYEPRVGNYSKINIYEGSCEALLCIYADTFAFSNLHGRRFPSEVGKTYFFEVFYPGFEEETFNLLCHDKALNAECLNSSVLICGDTLRQNLSTHNVSFQKNCDESYGFWYVLPEEEGYYKIKVSGTYAQLDFLSGICGLLSCEVSSNDELIVFKEAGATGFIRISTFDTLSFSVNTDCLEELPFDCQNPLQLSCGETNTIDFGNALNIKHPLSYALRNVILTLNGDGNHYILSNITPIQGAPLYIRVYKNNCETITTDFFYDPYFIQTVIPTEVGVTYYIEIFAYETEKKVTFSVMCSEPPAYENCEESLSVDCGQRLTYDPNHRSSFVLEDGNTLYHQAWYTFEPTLDLFRIDLKNQPQYPVSFILYESSDDCDSLVLVDYLQYQRQSEYVYPVVAGKTYFLQLGRNLPLQPDQHGNNDDMLTFSILCMEGTIPGSCVEAVELTCGDTKSVYVADNPPSGFGFCSEPFKGAWLKVEGNGKAHNLFFDSDPLDLYNMKILLGEGQCDSLVCIRAYQFNFSGNVVSFASELGKTYYIFVYQTNQQKEYFVHLRLSCDEKSENDACAEAIEIHCGDQLSGNTQNIAPDTSNPCDDTDKGLYYYYRGDNALLTFEFNDLTSSGLDMLVFENSCAENGRCLFQKFLTQQNGQKVVLKTKNNTDYYFKFSDSNNSGISIRVNVSCSELPENLSCSNASFLNCSDTVDLNFTSPLGFNDYLSCSSISQGYHQWFYIPKTDKLFVINRLNQTRFFGSVSLIKGNCNGLECIRNFGNTDSIYFRQDMISDYYLVFSGDESSYDKLMFSAECRDVISNDDCSHPIELMCGDTIKADLTYATLSSETNPCFPYQKDLWYETAGIGQLLSFRLANQTDNISVDINIFEKKDCNELVCLKRGTLYSFLPDNTLDIIAEANKEYLISIQSNDNQPVNILTFCNDVLVNDLCSGAITLPSSGMTEVIVENSTSEENTPCLSQFERGVWYTFSGNDSILILDVPTNLPLLNLSLFEGSCEQLICIKRSYASGNEIFKWFAEKGKTYYLFVSGENSVLRSQTIPLAVNHFCASSEPISCGETNTISFKDYASSNINFCNSSSVSVAWFEMTGTGENMEISFSNVTTGSVLYILDVCEGVCLHSQSVYPGENNPLILATKPGKIYYLGFHEFNSSLLNEVTFHLRCIEGIDHVFLGQAENLKCKTYTIEPDSAGLVIDDLCTNVYLNQFWYHFVGDGSALTYKTEYGAITGAKIMDSTCFEYHIFYENNEVFITESGKPYFFMVYQFRHSGQETFTFDIDYQCDVATEDTDKDNFEVSVFPNPSVGPAMLEISTVKKSTFNLEIKDTHGRSLVFLPLTVDKGKNYFPLENLLPKGSGLYFIHLVGTDSNHMLKMIKME